MPRVFSAYWVGGTPSVYEAKSLQSLVLILAIEGLTGLVDKSLPGVEVTHEDSIAISELLGIGKQPVPIQLFGLI
jgi:hypothetical protein